MLISPDSSYEIIFSLYSHEYLGLLFESYAVELDNKGAFTLRYQNISPDNAKNFRLKPGYIELIEEVESMQQDKVLKRFCHKRMDAKWFFERIYQSDKEQDRMVREEINRFLDRIRNRVLQVQKGGYIYETSKEGYPANKRYYVDPQVASVLFHFRRDSRGTNYYPTVKHNGNRIEINKGLTKILCNIPSWVLHGNVVLSLGDNINANKLQPFLKKNHVHIPKRLEKEFFTKFGTALLESFEVRADGELDIIDYHCEPVAQLEIQAITLAQQGQLFENESVDADKYMIISISFLYGDKTMEFTSSYPKTTVHLAETSKGYVFNKYYRKPDFERQSLEKLIDMGLNIHRGKVSLKWNQAVKWMVTNYEQLKKLGYQIKQNFISGEILDLKPRLELLIEKKIDWFELSGRVCVGEVSVPFQDLIAAIKKGQLTLKLSENQNIIIPEEWIEKFAHIINLSKIEKGVLHVKPYHVPEFEGLDSIPSLSINSNFKIPKFSPESVVDVELPENLEAELRPYQKIGYNWLVSLYRQGLGGCLADDMGLGKTVQCLAVLCLASLENKGKPSLLIMPTSLISNWKREIERFAPKLKYLIYTGYNRTRDIEILNDSDVVMTTYSTARIDIEMLEKLEFTYIILDESQTIKNPGSQTTIALNRLKSRYRLLLSGTPIQNSTLDLWSQMNFANPGLLGGQSYFKSHFLSDIEKSGDIGKVQKLAAIVKPFILRRTKEQVAADLPEKVENTVYCEMLPEQAAKYEQIRVQIRGELWNEIREVGIKKVSIKVIEALTRLRQIANHPRLVEPNFEGGSGKFDEVMSRLESVISEGHKVLVFSQFTKYLRLFTQEFEKQNTPYCYLDGQTQNRQAVVDKFQRSTEHQVFMISLKAGGVGLNITTADYVFILDPWWNPATESQAISRAHRIGQTKTVFVYRFISQDTVEDKIRILQERKQALADTLVQDEQTFVKSFDEKDIDMLF